MQLLQCRFHSLDAIDIHGLFQFLDPSRQALDAIAQRLEPRFGVGCCSGVTELMLKILYSTLAEKNQGDGKGFESKLSRHDKFKKDNEANLSCFQLLCQCSFLLALSLKQIDGDCRLCLHVHQFRPENKNTKNQIRKP